MCGTFDLDYGNGIWEPFSAYASKLARNSKTVDLREKLIEILNPMPLVHAWNF